MIVYTGGTFDLFHWGHINFLKECRKLAGPEGKVWVALNTDEFVLRYKQQKTVFTLVERKLMLEASGLVDKVITNIGDEDSKPAIEHVRPNIVAISSDWARRDYYGQMRFTQDWLDERGIILAYIPHTKGISSTEIRYRLKAV